MADKILQFITADEWILKVLRELIIRFIILRRVNCRAAGHVRDSNFTKSDYLHIIISWKIIPWETGFIRLTSRYAAACAIKQCRDE